MKANRIAAALCGVLAAWPVPGPAELPAGSQALGLPEPGLLLFGSVTHAAGGLPAATAAVQAGLPLLGIGPGTRRFGRPPAGRA